VPIPEVPEAGGWPEGAVRLAQTAPRSRTAPPAPAPLRARPGEEAAAIALASLRFGEAPRIGFLGDSGCGKTEAVKRFVAAYLAACKRGVALIVDDAKPQPQYPGQLRRDPADLERRPPEAEPRIIVFRGAGVFGKQSLDPEEIARLQWTLAQRGRESVVVYDELDRAADNGQWKAGKESQIKWALGKGRSAGAASFWGTQETQAVPAEAFNQSTAILAFRMTGNPVRLLKDRNYLEPRGTVENVIPRLPGDDIPKSQRGYFVLLLRGRPWNGRVYRYGA